jgi:hypothetical protein
MMMNAHVENKSQVAVELIPALNTLLEESTST